MHVLTTCLHEHQQVLALCVQFFQSAETDSDLAYYSEMRESGFIDGTEDDFGDGF